MSTYEVKAELVIDDKKARKAIARIQKSLGALIKQLDLVNKKMGLVGRNMGKMNKVPGGKGGGRGGGGAGAGSYLMAGAAVGGLMVATRAIANQVSAASEFRREMEMGQLGLATMYNLVDKMPLDKSLARASDQMVKFNTMAAEAPGSGSDMMSIYSRLYGPMRKLGMASADIEKNVKGAAVMGKVMDIKDIGSLGRDVEEMLTGRAGKRTTKIFALANAWGLINMEAKEFNQLSPEKRMKITTDLIANFTKHGEAMARTWDGASEAFGGWFNIVRDFAASGAFTQLGLELYDLNKSIENNLPLIRNYMQMAGAKMGGAVSGMFTMGKAGVSASGINPMVAGEGAMAGGMVAAVAALGVFGAIMAKMLLPAAALAKVGAVIAGVGLGPILGIAAAAFMVLVAGIQLVMKNADTLGVWMMSGLAGVFGTVFHILSATFWGTVAAIRALVSVIIKILAPAMNGLFSILVSLGGVLLVVAELTRVFFETLARIVGSFAGFGTTAMEMENFVRNMRIMASSVVSTIGLMFAGILKTLGNVLRKFGMNSMAIKAYQASIIATDETVNAVERILSAVHNPSKKADYEFDENGAGGGGGDDKKFQGAPQINVQRMIINQEFKGKADPDRVVAAFKRSIVDQAEGALSSPMDIPGRS